MEQRKGVSEFINSQTPFYIMGSLTNASVQTEKARGRSEIYASMPSFFRAFSGRFSKYSFRKTLLHAQKVNSQPKAQIQIHAGKNIERFIKRLTTAIQKMWFAGCTV